MIRVFIITGVIKDMKRLCIFSAVFVSTFVVAANAGNAKINRPIVDLKNGRVQGISDHGMFIYRNIPYAAPPVGEWRCAPASTSKKLGRNSQTRSKFGQACPQPSIKGLNETIAPGNEDCLKLKCLYAKSRRKKRLLWCGSMVALLFTGAASEPYYRANKFD
jgi:para-nitrobenzyl esterase